MNASLLEKNRVATKKFSMWFKLRRTSLNLTQTQIAKELNVKPSSISNWENDVSKPVLNIEQMETLCRLLKVDLETLGKANRDEIEIDI